MYIYIFFIRIFTIYDISIEAMPIENLIELRLKKRERERERERKSVLEN